MDIRKSIVHTVRKAVELLRKDLLSARWEQVYFASRVTTESAVPPTQHGQNPIPIEGGGYVWDNVWAEVENCPRTLTWMTGLSTRR